MRSIDEIDAERKKEAKRRQTLVAKKQSIAAFRDANKRFAEKIDRRRRNLVEKEAACQTSQQEYELKFTYRDVTNPHIRLV